MFREELDVAVNFCGVAGGARAAPMEDIPRKVRPNIPGGNKAAGSSAARMGQVVEVLENEVAERLWDQWPEDSGRDVPVELVASDRVRGNGEGGRM